MTAADAKEMSVIMPALDEEKNIGDAIGDTLRAFDALGIDGEVIVVNDGSTDGTQALIERYIEANPDCVRLIRHEKPYGIGASFWDGVDVACGEIVVMLPGDNENDPYETLRYRKLLEHVDMVIPFIFNREARPFWRNMLSLLYRFIISTTFLVNFNYTNGTILYRKSILKNLDHRNNGFFFQTDILIRAAKKGYLFAEVPYRLGLRKSGESKAISFPSLWKVIKGYLRLVRDYYFSKKCDGTPSFSNDSQTFKRRNSRRARWGL